MKKITSIKLVDLTNNEKSLPCGGDCLCFCHNHKIIKEDDDYNVYYNSVATPVLVDSEKDCINSCWSIMHTCENPNLNYIHDSSIALDRIESSLDYEKPTYSNHESYESYL